MLLQHAASHLKRRLPSAAGAVVEPRATTDTAGACMGCRATQQHQHAAAGAALLLSGRRRPLSLSTAPFPLRPSPLPPSHAAAARSQSIRGLSSGPGEGTNANSSGGGGGGGKTGAGAGAKPSPGAKASQILHQGSVMYEDLERIVMKQVRATNQKRFRIGFATTLLATVWVVSTFGQEIRSFFSRHTAEVAKETLQNEALQIQTRELSAAVVQFILTDPEVLQRAQTFLQEAAGNDATKAALVELVKHVAGHPEAQDAVVGLARSLIPKVLQSQETLDQVTTLMAKVILEPPVQQAAVKLITELVQDEEVYAVALELCNRVLAEESVKEAVNALLVASSHKVLEDPEVAEHSKTFVAEVVADDSLQRTGGAAIWSSFQYSFQPKLVRVLWFGILCGVVAFMRNSAQPGGSPFG